MVSEWELTVRAYQKIKECKLRLSGLVLITGANNNGKSALVRAFRSLIINPAGIRYVKSGEPRSEVILKGPDVNITWAKGQYAAYSVNGSPYKKMGRSGALKDVFPESRFIVLDSGYGEWVLHIQPANSPMFPFSFGASERYRLFEPLLSMEKYNKVTQDVKDDLSLVKKRIIYLQGATDNIEKKCIIWEEMRNKFQVLSVSDALSKFLVLTSTREVSIGAYRRLKEALKRKIQMSRRIVGLKEIIPLMVQIDVKILELSRKLEPLKVMRETQQKVEILRKRIVILNRVVGGFKALDGYEMELKTLIGALATKKTAYTSLRNAIVEFSALKSGNEALRMKLAGVVEALSKVSACPVCERPF